MSSHIIPTSLDITPFFQAYRDYAKKYGFINGPNEALDRVMSKDNLELRMATTMLAVVAFKLMHVMCGEVAMAVSKQIDETKAADPTPSAKPTEEKAAGVEALKSKLKTDPDFINLIKSLSEAAGGIIEGEDDDEPKDEEEKSPFSRN